MRTELRGLVLVLAASVAFADPLVGSSVGNADTFVSEGSKLFNKKQYAKASDQFLKATRANPALAQTYVQLARAQLLAKDLPRSCYAYRVYLKSVADGPDRKKASAVAEPGFAFGRVLGPSIGVRTQRSLGFGHLSVELLSAQRFARQGRSGESRRATRWKSRLS